MAADDDMAGQAEGRNQVARYERLDFELPLVELEEKIEELRGAMARDGENLSEALEKLEAQRQELCQSIFAQLSPWQITQLARHVRRPHSSDCIRALVSDFQELAGDRMIADDPAIIAGLGRFGGRGVAVIGHEKGHDTKERVRRNFGMPRPEGYRKALRIMKLAERFGLPLITFIDTPGAFPGIDAEERGQSEAIATNLLHMAALRIPIIAVVIGEGGSGGALAIGVADRVAMLRYAVYSVISPEGCASILWRDAAKAEDAARAMGMTASRLHELGLIDAILDEPPGGAHRDHQAVFRTIGSYLETTLAELAPCTAEELVQQRWVRLRSYGAFQEAS